MPWATACIMPRGGCGSSEAKCRINPVGVNVAAVGFPNEYEWAILAFAKI